MVNPFSLLMGVGVGIMALFSGIGPIASIVVGSAGMIGTQYALGKAKR